MKTYEDLVARTNEFLARHWCKTEQPSPRWTEWEKFLCGSVPNHEKSGCYALFAGPELVYVGLGASRGGGRYVEHGLSRRLMAHVICADKPRGCDWARLQDPWDEVTAIHTLGFMPERAYLAAALETFLVRELKPRRNRRV